ncbi:hypothetical protein [Oceanithermus sp.]
MKKALVAITFVLALAAMAEGSTYSISASLGYNGGFLGGVEATWDCQLYQPPVGRLRPTIDLEYGAGGVQGAALMRFVNRVPNLPVGLGGGLGVRYQSGIQAYGRLDGMLKLDKIVGYPIVLSADAGYAYGFGAAPKEVVVHFKVGYCFEF